MLTDFEKQLYNDHLKVTRSIQGQPYKLRKDFTKLYPEAMINLKRLSRLLSKFPNIKPADYFKAPFNLYGTDNTFDLKYYSTQSALKAYTTYVKVEEDRNPDSEEILQQTKDSLIFLQDYITDNNLNVDSYFAHMTNNLPTFLLHLKERHINFYVTFESVAAENAIKSQESDILNFIFDNSFITKYNTYRTKYLLSKKCKVLVRQGIKQIQNKLNNTQQPN